jgi:hypothetical protein
MIKHAPKFNTKMIEDHYSKRDGVPIKYVCSTDLKASDVPMDIFFRETPHPEFGNRYFGLYVSPTTSDLMITGADYVEELEFGMVEDKDGDLWYSQSHHDCIFIDGNMIDGGRQYIRHTGDVQLFKVINGEMKRVE